MSENLLSRLEQSLRQSRAARMHLAARLRELEAEADSVRAELAEMDNLASQTEAARQLTYAAAARVDADAADLAYWTSCAKLIAGDTAMRVTTDAVQILGGYGYITEYPVERMMRDAKITQLYEGTQQIQRLIIARQILQRAGVGASDARQEQQRP